MNTVKEAEAHGALLTVWRLGLYGVMKQAMGTILEDSIGTAEIFWFILITYSLLSTM